MDNSLNSSENLSPFIENSSKMNFSIADWSLVNAVLARELSDQSFKTWLEPLKCLEFTPAIVRLGVPDSYFGNWLKSHYYELIQSAVLETSGYRPEIVFAVYSAEEKTEEKEIALAEALHPAYFPKKNTGDAPDTGGLNRKYTFDDFIIGPNNRFAHAAAMAVSEAPARNYNPLFIYGPVGLGKTHLMQAIAHEMKKRFPSFKILYISSEKFTNELITAIQKRSTPQFRSKYRNLDLILIDDIHFIAEKEATQEEFFHTFNTLYDAHKQIVVSSDRPPREIPGLEERLVSRFGWGLVTDIQPPDFETRVAILKKKMEKETVQVTDDVSFFIASQFKSNVRELEGALIRVVAYGTLTSRKIDLALAKEILQASVTEEERKISMDKIQRLVADYFNLKVSELRSKRRTKSIAGPRQIAMYLIRELTAHSLPEIGEYFGGRDHTTVLHAYNKIAREVAEDGKKLKLIEEIKDMLKRNP